MTKRIKKSSADYKFSRITFVNLYKHTVWKIINYS